MSTPLLRIENLRVDFPKIVAVDGLSMELNAGDVCGLIGPNGAGKTTTMRVIVGLQRPTLGAVRVNGHDPAAHPRECKRVVGFMPDAAPLYPKLRVHEFLEHYALAHDVANRQKAIRDCLELAWLTEKYSSPCGELSRGMKQRLMLAKTLLHDPKLLVLDEPASGIDPIGRIELRNLLLELRDMGKAILVSSHILSEMDQFCNRVAIMERGRMIRSGSIEELSRASDRRHMYVQWRTASARAMDILREAPGVENLDLTTLSAKFYFRGEDGALDALLARMIREDVRITEWVCLSDNLEQIFIESGAKDVM